MSISNDFALEAVGFLSVIAAPPPPHSVSVPLNYALSVSNHSPLGKESIC
jgi:hypothetical protein